MAPDSSSAMACTKNTATIQVVIDGYSAPWTAGNFVKVICYCWKGYTTQTKTGDVIKSANLVQCQNALKCHHRRVDTTLVLNMNNLFKKQVRLDK